MSVLEPIRSRRSGTAGLARGNEWSWFNHARYDNDGNLITKSDAKGTITCFGTLSGSACGGTGYDNLNRPLVKSYSDGTPQVNWSWDTATLGIGHLTSVAAAGVSSTSFSAYDGLGRPLGSTQTTAGTPYTFAYSYYPIGLNTVTYPSTRQITYGYDIGGRIEWVGGAKAYAGSTTQPLTYASFGGLQSILYGNGLYEQTCYNNRLQPTAVWVRNTNSNDCASPNSSDLLNLQLGYPASPHNNGNLTSQNIYASSSTPYSQNYTYGDGLNRLSSATETNGWTQTYVYDAYGNRAVLAGAGQYIPNPGQTPQTTSATSVPYNTKNQWTSAGYDTSGNGNMTGDGLNSMTYYADNLLKTSSNSNNSGVATYYYDGDGHRVQKVTSAGTTTYVYDAGGQLAAEYSTAALPVLCTTCWFTADHLGSTRLMTDSGGGVQRRYDFLPFGEEIPQGINGRTSPPYETGQQLTIPDATDTKFTSKTRDSESGLDFFGARYYSSAQGRWTTPDDPLVDQHREDPQTWNLYTYVRDNPLKLIDTDGRRIAVIENGRTQGNPIGHTAIAITGKGVFSFGTVDRNGKLTQLGSSMTDYISTQAGRRDTTVTIINTTPQQDQAAADALMRQNDKGAIEVYPDNCSSRSNAALDAAGIPDFPVQVAPTGQVIVHDDSIPGSAGARTKLLPSDQTQTVKIPEGTKDVPKGLDEFNPKPPAVPVPQNTKKPDGSS